MIKTSKSFALIFLIPLFSFLSSARADNHVEVEYAHADLTSGYDSWNDVNILNYFGNEKNQFIIETDYKHHFGIGAAVIGATYTRVYDELWYQDFSLAFSTDSTVLPGWVMFTEIHRKLLSDQRLVAGLGVGHNISREPYNDTYGLAELAYYFDGPISLQAGMRLNHSSPGSVTTTRGYGSINFVYERWDAMARFEGGREGYTVIGVNDFKNEFSSTDETLQAHYWFAQSWGAGLKFDWYQSDYYNRNQASIELLIKY